MVVNDLMPGRIYKFLYEDNFYICEFRRKDSSIMSGVSPNGSYYKNGSFYAYHSIVEANQEEKNWLNRCIIANNFIPFENTIQNKIYEIWY